MVFIRSSTICQALSLITALSEPTCAGTELNSCSVPVLLIFIEERTLAAREVEALKLIIELAALGNVTTKT